MDFKEVQDLIRKWQNEGKTVVLITGTFDLYHPGHVDYIEWCKQHGDKVVAGLNDDVFTKQRKGDDRPIIDEQGRLKQILSNRNIDAAFIAKTGKWGLVKSLRPNVVIFNGTDTSEEFKGQQDNKMKNFMQAFPNTKPIVYNQPRGKYSTSFIVNKIRNTSHLTKKKK